MMRRRSFRKEAIIVSGFIIGGALILQGFAMMSERRRTYRSTEFYERRFVAGQRMVVGGAAVCVLTLAGGLLIAYVALPFLARTYRGVTVEERIATLPDGTEVMDDTPDDMPLKHYLRICTANREVLEVRCSREIFLKCPEGTIGIAKVSGLKLISFLKSGSRPLT